MTYGGREDELLFYRCSYNNDDFVGSLWWSGNMIDKYIYKVLGFFDKYMEWTNSLFAPRCKCKKKKKNA